MLIKTMLTIKINFTLLRYIESYSVTHTFLQTKLHNIVMAILHSQMQRGASLLVLVSDHLQEMASQINVSQ